MNFQKLFKICVRIGLVLFSLPVLKSQPAFARDIDFQCIVNPVTSQPITMVVTPRIKIELIDYNDSYFNSGGVSLFDQCQHVTALLNKAVDENGGKLTGILLTTGYVNGLPVICYSGRCNTENILLTLSRGTDANNLLQRLFRFSSSTRPLYESSSDDNTTIDLAKLVEKKLYGDTTTDAPGPKKINSN